MNIQGFAHAVLSGGLINVCVLMQLLQFHKYPPCMQISLPMAVELSTVSTGYSVWLNFWIIESVDSIWECKGSNSLLPF